MNSDIANNKVYLQGIIDTEPELNHRVKDEEFYGFTLRVPRLSGQNDYIPIIISRRLMVFYKIEKDRRLALRGQFRSHNAIEGSKRRLILSVFAKEICEWDDTANPNVVELDGYMCKPAIYRTTPFAREICDVLLAVNRNYGKSDYIPCIAWGENAHTVSELKESTHLRIVGRIQSREYNKRCEGIEVPITKVAYEVSISKLIDD